MNEMSKREQDAAVIANYRAWCSEFDAIEAAAWSFALDQRLEELRELLSDGSATFADSALRTIDRLTAERDAAHEKIVSFGSTMADLIMLRSENTRLEAETIESAAILEKAVKESKAIVAGYNRAIAERDAARANEARWRERINAIIAIAESYECLAQNPDVETSVSQERLGFAQDIYQALGIESEASE